MRHIYTTMIFALGWGTAMHIACSQHDSDLITGTVQVLPYFTKEKCLPYRSNFWSNEIKHIDENDEGDNEESDISILSRMWISVHIITAESCRAYAKPCMEKFPEYLPLYIFKDFDASARFKEEKECVIGHFKTIDQKLYDFYFEIIYEPFLDDPQTMKDFWSAMCERFPKIKKDLYFTFS